MREFMIIESREDSRDPKSSRPREDFGTEGLVDQLRRLGHMSLEALAASNDILLRQLLAEENREEGK